MSEKWRDISGYEGIYKVSDLGKVKSFHRKSPMILKQTLTKEGYMRLELNNSGISKKFTVHRLVAAAFVDNPENKKEVNHIDGNKQNNTKSNLEWNTSSENQLHAFDTGLQKGRKGSNHHNAKLVAKDVIEIRRLYNLGTYKQVELAQLYGLHPRYVNLIIKKRRWKHV
jgi:hypothetical protein